MHVVLGATTMGISRERFFIGKTFHNHFQIMEEYLHSVWITITYCFYLALEEAIDHRPIVFITQISSLEREKIVTLWMLVSDDCSLPLFLSNLHILVNSCSILVACEMNEVWVRHCGVALSVEKARPCLAHFTYLKFLRENIHAEHFSWLLGVSFLANNALRSLFLLNLVHLFEELIGVLLSIHLFHNLLLLLLC